MVYTKKDWVGSTDPLVGDPGATPITEDALNHLETQYDEVHNSLLNGLTLKVITMAEWEELPEPRPSNTLYIRTP